MDTTAEVGSSLADEDRLFLWDCRTVEGIWPDLEFLLLRDRRWEEYYTIEAFKHLVLQPDTFTWTVYDDGGIVAMLIAQREFWPTMVTIHLRWAAAIPPRGLSAARKYLEFIELWAKRSGASRIEITGRFEWARVLASSGYEIRAVLLTRDLTDLKEH